MSINVSTIKNKSKDSRLYDNLKEFPMSLRKYLSSGKNTFDKKYFNRGTDSQMRFMTSAKYNMSDRDFGSNNIDIANIYYNILNSKEVQDLIDEYVLNRYWVYHPVRKFEKWNILSKIYYFTDEYYWLIILFNRIVDPFQDLLNFNIVRIPNISFIQEMPSNFRYNFTGGDFKLKV